MLEIDEKIIEFVRQNPETSQNQIAMSLDYSYSYCYQRIKKLVKNKKLQEERQQHRVALTVP